METVHLLSLGCAKNTADSELMLGSLVRAGFEISSNPDEAQVLLVNTCAFIEPAKKESIDAILEAIESKKSGSVGKRLVVAGCLAQRYGAELGEQFPEVDIFVGTGNFLELPELLRRTERPEIRPIPYPGAAHLLPDAQMPRVRMGYPWSAYLKVSEGCDHRCAFCIIPRIRGRHESRPIEDVVEEAHRLAEGGVRELNLIAQDLTAYGRDLSPRSSLAGLLERLARIDGIRWIRLLYCYPNFISEQLLATIAGLERVVNYIDMPLQHADDGVLRAMRRERSTDALRKLLDRIRTAIPSVTLRTSFIVGFPGEDDRAFSRLVDFVREQRFDRMGAFVYSREENTAAHDLPDQVPGHIKRRRRAELMEMQAQISVEKNQDLVGREIEVLVEGAAAGRARRLRARNSGQAPEIDGITLLSGEAEPGEIVRARVERAMTYDLYGRIRDASAQS